MLEIVCPACQAVNRLPQARLAASPSCGRCKTKLFSGKPLELNTSSFTQHRTRNGIPLLVDFWAPWCGPCKTMAPAFSAAAAQLEPELRLAKLNTEAEPALGGAFNVRSIPTLILFQHGKEIARQAGAMSQSSIVEWTRHQLAAHGGAAEPA